MNMTLTLTNPEISTWAPAQNLLVTLNVYQMGLLQVKVQNVGESFQRFRISDYGVGVEWGALIAQTFAEDGTGDYLLTITDQGVEMSQAAVEGQDAFDIKIQFSPFRI